MSPWTGMLRRVMPPPAWWMDVRKPLGHSYPWQVYTRRKNLALTGRLEQKFPVDTLAAELAAVLEHFAPKEQFGPDHVGGWSGIALHAIDGDPMIDWDQHGAVFAKTPALEFAPTMERIIDSFPCEKRRVRLLRLSPGKKVFWHFDPYCGIDSPLARLHVPIVTNDAVQLQISHEDCRWKAGELWYGDFSFPHRLQNAGGADRVHLVIDVLLNDEVREMMPKSLFESAREVREEARSRCRKMWYAWDLLFAVRARSMAARRKAAA